MEKKTVLVNGVKCTQIGNDLYGPGYQIGATPPGECGHHRKIGQCPYCWPVAITREEGDRHDDYVEKHPAFKQISISRVQGHARLYGSEFTHHNFMILKVYTSERRRGLSHDRYHERKELFEVGMSMSEWATFISSPNQGGGVPCTLMRIQGETISRLPEPEETKVDRFSKEMKDRMVESLTAMKELRELMAQGKGGTVAAKKLLDRAEMMLANNTEFVAGMFEEHIDKTVEQAKIEVKAYLDSEVQKAGLQALQGKGPLSMDAPKPKALPEGE